MPKCAFLSTDNLEGFFVYDELVKPHLAKLGWQVDDVSWHNEDVDYNQYDVVIVRSTWDYQAYVDKFIQCLNKIEASSASLENPFSLLTWNIRKDYLQELSQRSVPVLPSLWFESLEVDFLQSAFEQLDTDEIVIKPMVSANADHTYRIKKETLSDSIDELLSVFSKRSGLIQAFEQSIVKEGEYSLFYFSGSYSHAILKQPKKDDFRVQEEHGGKLSAVTPNKQMRALASQTLDNLPTPALYARIDIVNTQRGYELIEVELIEPSLYFSLDEGSAIRFATAINEKYCQLAH